MNQQSTDNSKEHWESVYRSKAADSVSWFQPHANISLTLIAQSGVTLQEAIIDIGGGASTLVDDLLARGYSNLSVLDISAGALAAARRRLGAKAAQVNWIVGDITATELPAATYWLWHDRAVFHFLINAEDRCLYIQSLRHALRAGGHLIMATFAEDGPEQCSGLPVRRYSIAELQQELGDGFCLQRHEKELHRTPSGAMQKFNYCWFQHEG